MLRKLRNKSEIFALYKPDDIVKARDTYFRVTGYWFRGLEVFYNATNARGLTELKESEIEGKLEQTYFHLLD
jgi:hypothetical protein